MQKILSIEPLLFFFLTFILLMVWGFWEVAEYVVEGDTHDFDKTILLMFRNPEDINDALGPGWFQEMMRDVSGLGSVFTLSLFTLAATTFFILTGRMFRGIYLFASVSIGMIASNLLKVGFDRPRPDLVPHGSSTYSLSFPSSHSLMSAVVYLSLGALLAQAHPSKMLKVYFLSLAVLLTFIIGVSRVYLGVHWPSDVVAGWLAGSIFAAIFWLGETYIFRKSYLARQSSKE